MYRLLVVDDEVDIANGLSMYLKNIEHLNLDIHTAYSGDMALEWLNYTKIDIVITDIKMPGITGLQLVEEIRRNWPDCEVIFLTGYNEFEYVYTAIKYEGVNYVLKTEGNDEVVKAIEKAIDRIKKSLKFDDIITESMEYIKKVNILLQKEYFYDLLQGENGDAAQRKQQFIELGIELCAEMPVFLMTGRIEYDINERKSFERTQIMCSIKLIAEKCFTPAFSLVQLEFGKCSILWIIQPLTINNFNEDNSQKSDWKKNSIIMKGIAEKLQASCKESLGISLSLVYDSDPSMWEDIPDKYEAFKFILNYRIGTEKEILIDKKASGEGLGTAAKDKSKKNKVMFALKQIRNLENFLEAGQKDEFINSLKSVFDVIREVIIIDSAYLSEIIISISLVFISYINRWNLSEKLVHKINWDRLVRMDIHLLPEDAMSYFMSLSEIIFDLQKKEEEDRAIMVVNRIIQYVNDNMGSDLSIIKLAEAVYFNPQYLSRLFKKVTGTTILSYINEVKLNKAKEMIRSGNYKIHEVSEALGFLSAAYFTQFFKRSVGISPQEYRSSVL